MILAWLVSLVRRRPPLAPSARDLSEIERRITRRRIADENAPYWCRACGHATYHPQCAVCRGRCWARRLDGVPTDGGTS